VAIQPSHRPDHRWTLFALVVPLDVPLPRSTHDRNPSACRSWRWAVARWPHDLRRRRQRDRQQVARLVDLLLGSRVGKQTACADDGVFLASTSTTGPPPR
jgi:hypothetical protein